MIYNERKTMIDIVRIKCRRPHPQDYKKYYIQIEDKEMYRDIINLLFDAGYRHTSCKYSPYEYGDGCGIKNFYFDNCVVSFNPQCKTFSINYHKYCTEGRNYYKCRGIGL